MTTTVIKGGTVVGPLTITSTSPLPNGNPGAAYSTTVAASGGIPPYAWTATGLPSTLSIDSASGVISGTPAAGVSTVTITVTDARKPTAGTASKTFTITIAQGVTITTTSLATGTIGVAYSAPVAATGGATPYTWSAVGLPAGFTINTSTGTITGTTNTASSGTVTVTVTDATSPTHLTTSKDFTLTISASLDITTEARDIILQSGATR